MAPASKALHDQPSLPAVEVEPTAPAAIPQAKSRTEVVELTREVLALAEGALSRLPAEGACLVCGSLSPEHDKSGFSTALAMGFQLISSMPTLLVDLQSSCDSDKAGLIEVLRGETTLNQATRAVEGSELRTLPSGHRGENASELLVSKAFREFLDQARSRFKLVILHNRSLLAGEESLSIISRADAVIATLKRGHGCGRDVVATRQLCEQFKTAFLGVVLT
jgi:Mrp family chromosome partitioning ATPase